MNEREVTALRRKVVELAGALLDGRVDFLEGVRSMFALASNFPDPERFENFIPFIDAYSETDTFPSGDVRNRWSKEALQRMDKELAEAEQFYRSSIAAACRELIKKWG